MFDRAESAARQVISVKNQLINARRWASIDPLVHQERLDLAISLAEPPAVPFLHPETRTVRRCAQPGSPKGVICSVGSGPFVNLLSVATPTLFAYADEHGWDVVLSTESDLSEGRAASWSRIPLIRSLMDEYDLVWWMDADSLIVDLSLDIRSVLQPDRDLYLVEHYHPTPHGFAASCGVMLWRASDGIRTSITTSTRGRTQPYWRPSATWSSPYSRI
jgi:hypothetical protein